MRCVATLQDSSNKTDILHDMVDLDVAKRQICDAYNVAASSDGSTLIGFSLILVARMTSHHQTVYLTKTRSTTGDEHFRPLLEQTYHHSS